MGNLYIIVYSIVLVLKATCFYRPIEQYPLYMYKILGERELKRSDKLTYYTCTDPISRDCLVIQGAEGRWLIEEWLQTLCTEEVATVSLHGVLHGQLTQRTLVSLQQRMNKLAAVARHRHLGEL